MSRPSHPKPAASAAPSDFARYTYKEAKARIRSHPKDAVAWKCVGYHELQAGRLNFARATLRHAIELDPRDAATHTLLGSLERGDGDDVRARQHFEQALALVPTSVEANLAMSDIYGNAGGYSEALGYLDRLSARAADSVSALSRRGLLLQSLHRYDEAEALFRKLIERDPRQHWHWNNLGLTLRSQSRLQEAYACFLKSSALLPSDPVPVSNHLTTLHYDPAASIDEILAMSQRWGKLFQPARPASRATPADRSAGRVLRVGMMSDGFRRHPVGSMITPALAHLAGYGIEIHAYTTSHVVDEITKRIMAACASWQSIASLKDDELDERIREDRIDILMDLSGHNAGTRMPALTREPAPIIAKWVGGLIGTTGVKAIDYLVSDRIESPLGSDDQYSEKLIRLPDDYICYLPPTVLPAVGPLPALRNGYVTFGCFNNPTKVNPELLAQWAQLMHQVPGSHLLLKGGQFESSSLREQVLHTLAGHGIPRSRIRIEGQSHHPELLATYNDVDVALDTWPYSGGLTTCEALIMGVPVVTLPGPTFAGRHSATHLVNVGLPELVVDDWDSYRARVVELVGDLPGLATLRSHLRDVLLQSPVCDGERFAGNLANALRAIWQRYTEGKAPAALALDDAGTPYFEDEEGPTQVHHPVVESDDMRFQWQFQGKLIAVDNGGSLLARPAVQKLLKQRSLELVVFDPASHAANTPVTELPDVHYCGNLTLGDGQPATLFACMDAAHSGSLEPLPADGIGAPTSVLVKLPLNTVALDSITGLSSLDWLVLDARNDSTAILTHGERTVKNALLVEARIVFEPTHARQPNLTELQQWAAHQGFQLYRLHATEHAHPSSDPGVSDLWATRTMHADALFLPSKARLQALDSNSRTKLAFLLHDVYGLQDAAYDVLSSLPLARLYLDDVHITKVLGESATSVFKNVRMPAEADTVADAIRRMSSWSMAALNAVIARTTAARSGNDTNNTAHFLQTHALLVKGRKVAPSDVLSDPELRARLARMQWSHKSALYGHWFNHATRYAERPKATISAVLISNRFKPEIVETARILREQKQGEIEIIFVNNGAPPEDFARLVPLLDVWVELKGNSGAYLARNLGAVYANAPILFFVEDDGIPQDGFVDAHLEVHASHQPVCLRGVYMPLTKGSELPPHYYLGKEIIPAPPHLEGNASFNTRAFETLGGWGDYILFGHGGWDFARRLERAGVPDDRQLYTPASVLLHDYIRGEAHRSEKFAKQAASHMLLHANRQGNGPAVAGRTVTTAAVLQGLSAQPMLTALPAAPVASAEELVIPDAPPAPNVERVRSPALLLSPSRKVRTAVGLPLYNEEKFVEQTVRSLKDQNIDDVRFLIADNASTDRTVEIVLDVVGNDARFEVFQQEENRGAYANFCFVQEHTQSDYFMWLGGHDYLSTHYLTSVTRLLDEQPDVSMACGMPYKVKDDSITLLKEAIYDFSDPSPAERYLKAAKSLVNCTIVQSLFRREHIRDFELREVISGDKVFISHLLWKGKLAFAKDATYFRRYFDTRAETSSERITGRKGELSRDPFRDYYRDTLDALARDTLAPDVIASMQAQIEQFLVKRYGQ